MAQDNISGRAAIVGLGVTEFSKNSGRTELRLALEATLAALADAGIAPEDVDGFSSYTVDKVPEYEIARLLGAKDVKFFSQVPHGAARPARRCCTRPWPWPPAWRARWWSTAR